MDDTLVGHVNSWPLAGSSLPPIVLSLYELTILRVLESLQIDRLIYLDLLGYFFFWDGADANESLSHEVNEVICSARSSLMRLSD